MFVVLNIICTFVEQSSFRRNPKLFIYDKRLPKGNIFRKVCCQFLELDCNPKGNLAHKFISTMQSERKFVNASAYATFTQLQKEGENLKQSNFTKRSNYHAAALENLKQQYKYARLAFDNCFNTPNVQPLKPNLL